MRNKYVISVVFLIAVLVATYGAYRFMVKCEGTWEGEPLESKKDISLEEIGVQLKADVHYMSVVLGERNPERYEELARCAEWIRKRWQSQGYEVKSQVFTLEGKEFENLEIEIPGHVAPSEIIIVSGQYDTLPDSPGANNNGSGMAVLLKLSELLRDHTPDRTIRLVAFTTEEDPYFGTEMMGSYLYAKRSRERGEDVRVMLSLDAIGYFTNAPGSQKLPFPFSLFYPDKGDFLAFIGDFSSRPYMLTTTRGFKKGSSFPIEAGVVPQKAKGASWSDHSSFWRFGYPGIMITDTGGFRSQWHTTSGDTMEKLDFEALSRIVPGMYSAVVELSSIKH